LTSDWAGEQLLRDMAQKRLLPPLETPCADCNGKGWYWPEDRDKARRCEACAGAGYVPTGDGKRILDLMRHSIRAMVAEIPPAD
jgi:hypothetical protein